MSDESHFLLIYWEVLVIWKAAWQAEWVITLKDFINCKQERALSSPCPCLGTVQNSNNSGFPLISRSPTTLISPLISRVPRFPWPCSGSSLAFAWSHRSDARSQDKRHQTVTLARIWSGHSQVWVFNLFLQTVVSVSFFLLQTVVPNILLFQTKESSKKNGLF